MVDILAWRAAVESVLRAQADASQAVPMKAYMLGQFEFLGIRAGPRREALKALPKFSGTADELLALAHALWQVLNVSFDTPPLTCWPNTTNVWI